jgi:hypothetical protein
MAVWAYFPFDGRVVDSAGTKADWAWAMSQWDRVVAAGPVVRLVVVHEDYSRFDISTPTGQTRISDVSSKIGDCLGAGQLVFGRVYVAGGKLPLSSPGGALVNDPLQPGRKVPPVEEQIEAWVFSYGPGELNGIYLDSGPTACTDPNKPFSEPGIRDAYRSYAALVKAAGYDHLFVQASQHPDNDPGLPWLRELNPNPAFFEVWEGAMLPYRTQFEAKDPCRPGTSAGVPAWWDPGEDERWSRVHAITDCTDAPKMRSIVDLAIRERGAGTIWVTRSRLLPGLGRVFDVLPSYWEDEVALFRPFVEADEQQKGKEEPEKTEPEKTEPEKTEPEKTEPEKTEPEKTEPEKTEPEKTEPEKTEPEKTEPEKTEPEGPTEKELKDEADKDHAKDDKDDPPEFLKEGLFEHLANTDATAGPGDLDVDVEPEAFDEATAGGQGRTFIRPEERPEVGRVVTDEATPDEARPDDGAYDGGAASDEDADGTDDTWDGKESGR